MNSAKTLTGIMKKYNIDKKLIDDIFYLVHNHEIGGNKRANLLKYADTISFFQVNLPHYYLRNTTIETKRRVLWGYNKLPDSFKKIVAKFNYHNEKLKILIKNWISNI